MTAQDIIDTICANLRLDPLDLTACDRKRIRYALEDGAALLALGLVDNENAAIDEAHDLLAGPK